MGGGWSVRLQQVKNGSDVIFKFTLPCSQPLFDAIEVGHLGKLRDMLQSGVRSKDVVNAGGWAARVGECKALSILLENISSVDDLNFILTEGADGGHRAVAQLLLDCGATPQPQATKSATSSGSFAFTQELLAARADPNAGCPLHNTAWRDASEVAHLLLMARADPDAIDQYGRTPLICCATAFAPHVAKVLLNARANTEVVAEGEGADGKTPLMVATNAGSEEMVRLLLQFGAPSVAKDLKGRSPLNFATHNNIEILELLRQQQIVPNDHAAP